MSAMPRDPARLVLRLFCALAFFSWPAAWAADPAVPGTASVVQFYPQGEFASVRQVTARFSTDMVRLGDPRVRNPFIISCVAKGHGRWIDTRNWAYDFEQDVPQNRSCTFNLVKGLKALNGQALGGTQQFGFNTSPLSAPLKATPPTGFATVDFFVPQGTARAVRQVQVRFSENMVSLGAPHLYNPFTVQCPLVGRGRWVDMRNWVLDFDRDLPTGIACSFNLAPGLKSLAGRPVKTIPAMRFDTGGPQLVDSMPRGNEIDENQVFLLKFNGVPDTASLPKASYCTVQGINEAVPLRFLSIPETTAFVAKLPDHVQKWWRQGADDAGFRQYHEWRAVACARQLPPAAKVSLVFDHTLTSVAGVANAQDQHLDFRVRPDFSARFSCQRENARKPCEPTSDMSVDFTEDVDAGLLQKIRLEGGGRSFLPQPNAEGGHFQDGRSISFKAPLPANASLSVTLPPGFMDVSGRTLVNAARFPLPVKTTSYPALAKFAADFGVVELASGAVPLTIRNLQPLPGVSQEARLRALRVPDTDEGLVRWLQRFQAQQNCYTCVPRDKYGRQTGPDPRAVSLLKKDGTAAVQELPKVGPRDFQVMGVPVPKPGVYIHEVESTYLGDSLIEDHSPMYVSAMSVVTNLGVHFRQGTKNSLIWVTTLDKAQPVANAEVSIWDCEASQQTWQGKTDADGLVAIEGDEKTWLIQDSRQLKSSSCQGSRYVIIAHSGEDRAIVLPSWEQGIESWRFQLPYGQESGETVAHTVLDRTLFRAGETVHMRHVVRELGLRGLLPPAHQHFKKISVVFNNGDAEDESSQEYPLKLNIDADGNGDNEWTIPKAARLGSYSVRLDGRVMATFRVEEFRLPVLSASVQLPKGPLVAPTTVPVDMQLHYLNGGAYAKAPVKLRARLTPGYVQFEGLYDYTFSDPGIQNGYYGDGDEGYEGEEGGYRNPGIASGQDLETRDLVLDAAGGARADNGKLPAITGMTDLYTEMEYRDPSGETQTTSAHTTLWPAAIFPGIRVADWVSSSADAPVTVDIVTVGTMGTPQAGVPVKVTGELHTTQTHRKRVVGGFYSYESVSQNTPVPVDCAGSTGKDGKLQCHVSARVSGELYLRVTAQDGQGHTQSAGTSVWVEDGHRWWFRESNDDRIDLIPEKKEYAPGETMRLQARMPFPNATALVSVERDGVIEHFVQQLSSKNPVITLPAKGDYAPNVYISAFLIRGRNDDVAPTALVDLGKPAFKLGIASVRVGWDTYRLGVAVKADKLRYHPREKAQVAVTVTPPKGQALPPHTEVVLAAVDEALLQLADNDTGDVLTRMMLERGYRMETATSQLQVVGKRHYGRKALPSGGGGGRGRSTRELFDTLLYWKARAPVDASGQAQFTVPLNDSLSGFKLVAVAISDQHFGDGSARIESFQDVQIVSGLPLVVRQGDKLDPGFTVRNASDTPQQLHFRVEVDGMGTLVERDLSIAAGQAELVPVPFTVPANVDSLKWTASAEGKDVGDRMSRSEKVLDPLPERVLQGTLAQLEAPLAIPVQKPADALPGGGIRVLGRARLTDSLDSVKKYFADYPYLCLEQKTSKSVGLQDQALWADVMNNLPSYLDANGLAAFYPPSYYNNLNGSTFLTAYILSVSKAIGWQVPESSRERMLQALVNVVDGKLPIPDHHLHDLDNDANKLEVLNVLAQYGRFRPDQIDSIRIDPPRWTTHMLVDWFELLRASRNIPDRAARLTQAENLLRSHLTLQGSALLLSEGNYNWWWLYDTSGGTLARLMIATMDLPAWKEDQPRLLRGLLMQQRHGAWATTVTNLWGGIALKHFGDRFETAPVSGQTVVAMAAQQKALDWAASAPGPVQLDWPAEADTVHISQAGTGKPWITVQSVARLPLKTPLSTGITVTKSFKPVQQKVPGKWSVGDVVRVRLVMNAQSDIGWVALDDPIPAGGTLLGRALAHDSGLLSSDEESGWEWPSYVEFAADAYRAYYQWISKGQWQAEYTLRLNQSGTFQLPPTRVEAMYAPEMFGMTPNAVWTVQP
jgi:uncharacterized protein YfaS (alpha-2-macroglobulin family)